MIIAISFAAIGIASFALGGVVALYANQRDIYRLLQN